MISKALGGASENTSDGGSTFEVVRGFRAGDRTYRRGDRAPIRYRMQSEALVRPTDPGTAHPDLAPNVGRSVIPHMYQFSGIISTLARSYRNHDEAIRHSRQNAMVMLHDPQIAGPLFARQTATALLDHSVVSENDKDPKLKAVADGLNRIISKTKRFTEYRRWLLEAMWYGRVATQNIFRPAYTSGGRRYWSVQNWVPVQGDKLQFRYDDGTGRFNPEQVGVLVSPAHVKHDVWAGKPEVEWNAEGSTIFFNGWERTRLTVHKHMIRDGDYHDPNTAGMINGVGIRHFLYWIWYQKQETLAQLAQTVERTSMGFTIYWYPSGNDQARDEVTEIANNQANQNQIIMPYDAGNPDAYRIEQVPPNTGGIAALQSLIDDYFANWIIRFILGQTLSMKADATGLGSGLSDLHQDSLMQVIRYDAVNLEETITNKLLVPLLHFNYPEFRNYEFNFRIHAESKSLDEKMPAILQAWQMGAEFKTSDVMDLIGMSIPRDDDEKIFNPDMAMARQQMQQQISQAGQPQGMFPGTPPLDGQEPAEGEAEIGEGVPPSAMEAAEEPIEQSQSGQAIRGPQMGSYGELEPVRLSDMIAAQMGREGKPIRYEKVEEPASPGAEFEPFPWEGDTGRTADQHVVGATRGERDVMNPANIKLTDGDKAGIKSALKSKGYDKFIARAQQSDPSITSDTGHRELGRMIRQTKSRFPHRAGWINHNDWHFSGLDDKGNPIYKATKYKFANDPKKAGKDKVDFTSRDYDDPRYQRHVRKLGDRVHDEIVNVYNRAKTGDKSAQNIIAQAGWYNQLARRLRSEYGGFGDLFADLLGATSPNTKVQDNWRFAIDIMKRASSGELDDQMPKWNQWADDLRSAEADLIHHADTRREQGETKKAVTESEEFKEKMKRVKDLRDQAKEIMPVKDGGTKYGMNGDKALLALVDSWRQVQNDYFGKQAPKARNFSHNLIGASHGATIDVWAARMLNRLAGHRFIPPPTETNVSGDLNQDYTTTGQFRVGQDAFAHAVDRLREHPELSKHRVFSQLNPDDLQAIAWFLEKEHWTQRNFTPGWGEGGSFELMADLEGADDQEAVRKHESVLNRSVIDPADIEDADLAEQAKELQKRISKTPAGRERVKLANEYTTLTASALQDRKQEAVDALVSISKPVSRFVLGLTPQRKRTATDKAMDGFHQRVITAAFDDNDVSDIRAVKSASSRGGESGDTMERAVDAEIVTREGFNPVPLRNEVFAAAKGAGQDSAFIAQTIHADDEVTPHVHRPGIEIYFSDPRVVDDIMKDVDAIKEQSGGLVSGFTVVADARPSIRYRGGQEVNGVGLRAIILPEMDARHDPSEAERLGSMTDEELAQDMTDKHDRLVSFANHLEETYGGVSSAFSQWYRVETRFKGEFDEPVGTSEGDRAQSGGTPWKGRSVSDAVAGAARGRRAPGDRNQRGKGSSARSRGVSRRNSKRTSSAGADGRVERYAQRCQTMGGKDKHGSDEIQCFGAAQYHKGEGVVLSPDELHGMDAVFYPMNEFHLYTQFAHDESGEGHGPVWNMPHAPKESGQPFGDVKVHPNDDPANLKSHGQAFGRNLGLFGRYDDSRKVLTVNGKNLGGRQQIDRRTMFKLRQAFPEAQQVRVWSRSHEPTSSRAKVETPEGVAPSAPVLSSYSKFQSEDIDPPSRDAVPVNDPGEPDWHHGDDEHLFEWSHRYPSARPTPEPPEEPGKYEKPDGKPSLLSEPHAEAASVADSYVSANKELIGSRPELGVVKSLDKNRSKRIADAFEAMPHQPDHPDVKASYQAMADETMSQYKHLVDNGYTFELIGGDDEPYSNSNSMIRDLDANRRMKVFATDDNFGEGTKSSHDESHPMLQDSGYKDRNGRPMLVNDAFRAVHDYFGHAKLGNGFGPIGEENAWREHSKMFSDLAVKAMTTETRGQNSWVNFGKHLRREDGSLPSRGDHDYVHPADRPFAEQKTGLLDPEHLEYSKEMGEGPSITDMANTVQAVTRRAEPIESQFEQRSSSQVPEVGDNYQVEPEQYAQVDEPETAKDWPVKDPADVTGTKPVTEVEPPKQGVGPRGAQEDAVEASPQQEQGQADPGEDVIDAEPEAPPTAQEEAEAVPAVEFTQTWLEREMERSRDQHAEGLAGIVSQAQAAPVSPVEPMTYLDGLDIGETVNGFTKTEAELPGVAPEGGLWLDGDGNIVFPEKVADTLDPSTLPTGQTSEEGAADPEIAYNRDFLRKSLQKWGFDTNNEEKLMSGLAEITNKLGIPLEGEGQEEIMLNVAHRLNAYKTQLDSMAKAAAKLPGFEHTNNPLENLYAMSESLMDKAVQSGYVPDMGKPAPDQWLDAFTHINKTGAIDSPVQGLFDQLGIKGVGAMGTAAVIFALLWMFKR